MGATAEALNYDYDYEVIDTPKANGVDQTVRCYTDSELNTAFANLLKDSLSVLHKAELETEGLEIRKRNRELIIREKKKAKLFSMIGLGFMATVMMIVPLLGNLLVKDTNYLWMYSITGPTAAYFLRELKNTW